MTRATILGAGAMGTAFARPLVEGGFDVALWGTPLDDDIVGALRRGEPHPRTRSTLATDVLTYSSEELEPALVGSSLLILAVSSVGAQRVLVDAVGCLRRPPDAILILTKGLIEAPAGRLELVTEAANRILESAGMTTQVVGVGGPCKANEVAAGRPTWAVYSCTNVDVAAACASQVSSDVYHALPTTDVSGVEVSAALKNLYAVALGACDGFATAGGEPWHDLRAVVFAQAVSELVACAEALGGRAQTALGLAGMGDLEVTGQSGRNREYGERLGRGESPANALRTMTETGLTVEGAAVAALVPRLLQERAERSFAHDLPLLDVLVRALSSPDGEAAPEPLASALVSACLAHSPAGPFRPLPRT